MQIICRHLQDKFRDRFWDHLQIDRFQTQLRLNTVELHSDILVDPIVLFWDFQKTTHWNSQISLTQRSTCAIPMLVHALI